MSKRLTESDSNYNHLEKMSTMELLQGMNTEDKTVPDSIEECLPAIENLVDAVYKALSSGGRLIYMGSGTSGRLGIVDASECPPTYGVDYGVVIGLIAGGDSAIRRAVEHAEDDTEQGWKDLVDISVTKKDIVVGISASGTAPYVVGALIACKSQGITTGSISCNLSSKIGQISAFPVDCPVGPEFVTGSTRMKSGTAQKLILNMITTSVMVKLGHVRGNKMVDMQLSNNKLIDRGVRMIQEITKLPEEECAELLEEFGSVRKAIESLHKDKSEDYL